MITLSRLQNIHTDKPAAILGGGESLLDDLSKVPSGAILIAVNYHAFKVGLKPHYMVYLDDPRTRPQMMRAIREEKVIKVCPDSEPYGDVKMDVEYWRGMNSGTTAAWLGLWMGCNPVYLCGMDCYTGAKPYCHADYTPDMIQNHPLYDYMRPWVEECRSSVPHPERLQAVSGPLQSLFPFTQPLTANR